MSNSDEDRFDECLSRWETAADSGRDLSPLDLCPGGDTGFLEELAEAIKCLKACRAVLQPTTDPDDAKTFRADEYEGIEEISSGGQGRVIRARDRRLKREVAVKVPRSGWEWITTAARRFEQEAHISGSLEHPGVVPIYGFGQDSAGRPYYAMRYVRDERTLEHAITATHATPEGPGRTIAFQNLLRQFLTVCRTVDYAHSRGIIHRDIKPSNVLVGKYGEVFVVDWGIAKDLRVTESAPGTPGATGDTNKTAVGASTIGRLGTPAYMSPEQADDASQVGTASDVYGLGATLCHILTGRMPFSDGNDSVPVILQRVKEGKLTPHRFVPSDQRALAAVCAKAMSLAPADRYSSAGELASEIERWLADEPVTAWRDPLSVRLRRWRRRHRALVASGVVLLLMGVVTLAVAAGLLDHSNQQKQEFVGKLQQVNADLSQANSNLSEANTNLADALYRNQFFAALAALEQSDVGRAEALLDECNPERRSFEWHYAKAQCRGQQKVIMTGKSSIRAITPSPDGKLLAVATSDSTIRIIDSETGEARPLPKETRPFHWRRQGGAFHPNGSQFAAVFEGKWPLESDFVLAWNPVTGEARDSMSVSVTGLAISHPLILGYRNGGREFVLVKPSSSKLVLGRWDSATGEEMDSIPLGMPVSGTFLDGVLSPDGTHLAVWFLSIAHVRNIDSGKEIVLKGHTNTINAAAFSPNSKLLVTVSDDATVRVWDGSDSRELFVLTNHRLPIRAVAFSHDSKLFATAGDDRVIKVWDSASGREVATLRGHTDNINAVAFLRDGRLASGGEGGSVRVWRVTSDTVTVIGRLPTVAVLKFSPDSTRLFSGHIGEKVMLKMRVTNPANPANAEEFPAASPEFALSPDGATLATVTVTGNIELWDVAGRKKLRTIDKAFGPLTYSPDGTQLAAMSLETKEIPIPPGEKVEDWPERTTVLVLDSRTGEVRHRLEHARRVEAMVWLASGKIFTYTRDTIVTVWDSKTGAEVRKFNTEQAGSNHLAGNRRMAVSADGRFLATSGNDAGKTIRVWNPETGELRWEDRTHLRPVTALAFSPDSRRLASASEDRTVRLREAATGRELISLPGVRHTPFSLVFSADGRQLATGCQVTGTEGQILVWGRPAGP